MKIYIVTSGEYSDYSIDAIYTDEAVAKRLKAEGFRIEEWESDEAIDRVKQGYMPYTLYAWLDEDGFRISTQLPYTYYRETAYITTKVIDWNSPKMNGENQRREQFTTWTWAKDKDHAIKVAAERKAKLVYAYHEHGQTQMDF